MIEPTTTEEASEAMRAGGRAAIAFGAGTKPWCGTGQISTRRMTKIVDYSSGDMTITVEAGVTLDEIEHVTSSDNLRLALDPPSFGGRATIGGVLAANDSGPLRMAHGGPRDLVVGMAIVLGDGAIVKSGGRVVKNVAGYGVHRAMVGSCGRLGMIASATLKLQPRPEAMRLVVISARDENEAERLTAWAMGGAIRPAFVEWSRPATEFGVNGLAVILGFEDCAEAVEWQLEEVRRSEKGARALDEGESRRAYEVLREWGADVGFRHAMPSSAIPGFFRDAGNRCALLAHAGSGAVLAKGAAGREVERLSALTRESGDLVQHDELRRRLQAAMRMERIA